MATKNFVRLGNLIFYWGFIQIFLIGLAFFGVTDTGFHGISGLLLELCSLVMLIIAIAGKLGGRTIGLSFVLFALLASQGALIHTEGLPAITRALHPLFGIASMFFAQHLARGVEKRAMG